MPHFEAWGVKRALQAFQGMFAFALWDRENKKVYLARDRLGEKPLYYGFQGDAFLFGSELKALNQHPAFKWRINEEALGSYLKFNCIPAPDSIYEGIKKLVPGTYIEVDVQRKEDTLPAPMFYWDPEEQMNRAKEQSFNGTEEEAVLELDRLLKKAVEGQMTADVPLGAFLSGGVDSATVVSIMQAIKRDPVHTFTIGSTEEKYNEAQYAKEVANHLGTRHTELYVTPEQAREVIPLLPEMFDEPFADSSQIPTFLVSRLARHHVTVSLSGDGGDELFGGYNRHLWGEKLWGRIKMVPTPLRKAFANTIKRIPPDRLEVNAVLPKRYRQRLLGNKVHKFAGILPSSNAEDLYDHLVSRWKQPEHLLLSDWHGVSDRCSPHLLENYFTEQMMYWDMVGYLPDDILAKVDRASMAVSLESRAPFLDKDVVEFAMSLPLPMKVRGKTSKWILRRVLDQYVPKELIDRPKAGFGVPTDVWLRGPLREWAENLLDSQRIKEDGFFLAEPIRKRWEEHLSGRLNWQHELWTILMFQAWLDHNPEVRR